MTPKPALKLKALTLVILGVLFLAAGNLFFFYSAPAEPPSYALHYAVGAPVLLGLLLIWSLPRLMQEKAPGEPLKEKETLAPPEVPPKPSPAAALQLLVLLQREGRLVDFLQEDLDAYSDAQIGAAVRSIHQGCRKALLEHLSLKPVIAEPEGQEVTVPEGFDPAAIRLTGHVVGSPPFKGILRHRGWRASRLELPERTPGQDPAIIAPAEVEIL